MCDLCQKGLSSLDDDDKDDEDDDNDYYDDDDDDDDDDDGDGDDDDDDDGDYKDLLQLLLPHFSVQSLCVSFHHHLHSS